MIHFPKTNNQNIVDWLDTQRVNEGAYSSDDILVQLHEDFKGKCYICEDKVKSMRVEHFRPQCIGPKQKYDWANIFNACEHCNAIKSDNYRQLIDCTSIYPEQHIKFELAPLHPPGGQVVLSQLPTSTIHADTIDLLNAIYKGTNKRKQLEAQNIVDDLIKEVNYFTDLCQDLISSPNDPTLISEIQFEVNNKSKFTAFKRWVVKNNPNYNIAISQYFIN